MSGSVLIARPAIRCIKTQFSNNIVNNRINFGPVRSLSVSAGVNMKFVQFAYKEKPDEIRAGFVDGDSVVDVNKADSTVPTTLLEILKRNQLDKLKNITPSETNKVPLSSVTLKAPITGMDKVLCVGLNYMDHCKEQQLTPPEVPMIFSKFASCVVGPNDPVRLRTNVVEKPCCEIEMTVVIGKPASKVKAKDANQYILGYTIGQDIGDPAWLAKNCGQLILGKKADWEVELCVVIGKTASRVKAADAYQHVLGCTVAQDISARDWQKTKNAGQFLLGKAQDTFCPIGPWIVTPDETGDPETLDINCSINGELKQTSNTNQLVHKIPAIIERLSSIMTLLPGDIILTGTPGGVGVHRNPPEFLKPGDKIRSEIKNIGAFETKVVEF